MYAYAARSNCVFVAATPLVAARKVVVVVDQLVLLVLVVKCHCYWAHVVGKSPDEDSLSLAWAVDSSLCVP